jgi:hypothetical protein
MTTLLAILLLLPPYQAPTEAGLFVKSLWFLHEYGQVDCSSARNDRRLKQILAKAIVDDRELSFDEISNLVKPEVFDRFASADRKLSEAELTTCLESSVPATRRRLLPELCGHAQCLTTSFDMIDSEHFQAMDQLANWIAENSHNDAEVQILITCSGNSRRSILGAMMGNLAAAYYGFERVRFYSGGTMPSAFNSRTVTSLREIGFQIDATGAEAKRGNPQVPNPVYRVRWGEGYEMDEFSKLYRDRSNPNSTFAAIMVCSEADADCPVVEGATIRLSMTFLDPKAYDDGAFESRKYAERRDDIGRTLLATMANARRRLIEQQSAR